METSSAACRIRRTRPNWPQIPAAASKNCSPRSCQLTVELGKAGISDCSDAHFSIFEELPAFVPEPWRSRSRRGWHITDSATRSLTTCHHYQDYLSRRWRAAQLRRSGAGIPRPEAEYLGGCQKARRRSLRLSRQEARQGDAGARGRGLGQVQGRCRVGCRGRRRLLPRVRRPLSRIETRRGSQQS